MEKEKNTYKPIIWYKSEFVWLLISLGWQLIWFILIGQMIVSTSFIWVMLIGTTYSAYFILKGIVYAWFINPYNAWKRKRGK